MLNNDTIATFSVLLVVVYYLGPIILAAVCIPWLMNAFNGSGWWYNAGCCIGLSKRLEKRRQAKWLRERMEWEARRDLIDL